MVNHSGHDFSVDWWALGILIYEMTIGITPFFNRERKILLTKIKTSKLIFPEKRKYKIDYSDEFVDLVLKLLTKDKKDRLGSRNDSEEILSHPYFAKLDINAMLNYTMEPPLKFDFTGEVDKRYFNVKSEPHDLAETILPKAAEEKLKRNDKQFKNFDRQSRAL